MINAVEAYFENGRIGLVEPIPSWVDPSTKVIVLFSKSDAAQVNDEAISGTLLSERSLAVDWLRPEEDAAWAHLQ
jgi:hypothetical protein